MRAQFIGFVLTAGVWFLAGEPHVQETVKSLLVGDVELVETVNNNTTQLDATVGGALKNVAGDTPAYRDGSSSTTTTSQEKEPGTTMPWDWFWEHLSVEQHNGYESKPEEDKWRLWQEKEALWKNSINAAPPAVQAEMSWDWFWEHLSVEQQNKHESLPELEKWKLWQEKEALWKNSNNAAVPSVPAEHAEEWVVTSELQQQDDTTAASSKSLRGDIKTTTSVPVPLPAATANPPAPTPYPTQKAIEWAGPKPETESFPERWGVCDPRHVHETFKPKGKVYVVTFAGWSPKRVKISNQMADQVRALGYTPLLYTEKDLDKAYYDKFAWSFAKPHYRGFWTWKPWILRNLTETLLDEDDILYWMDSDRKITQMNWFQTALCNLQHRVHNPQGILAFTTCQLHTEERATKPEVFKKMGLWNRDMRRNEQIYAGSLGIRKTPHTLAFLQEWQNWGEDPIMFGDNDFREEGAHWKHYKGHKNDQSVFSLMVYSRNMEVWPQPYYYRKDCGLGSSPEKSPCLNKFQNAGYCMYFWGDSVHSPADTVRFCRVFLEWLATVPDPLKNGSNGLPAAAITNTTA